MSDVRNCPDCGAPVGEDWLPLGDCWLYGQMKEEMRRKGRSEKEIREWWAQGAGGGDPPCIGYNYDYGQEQLSRRRTRIGSWMALAAIVFALALVAASQIVKGM